ncbi:uncharacterized protein LOC126899322 isoform X2 [Daktulosphaira vitifoliae]|nr:uncharacterized protein LOC126899322 isoform X2 [Daktulosphaira vitifoliae]
MKILSSNLVFKEDSLFIKEFIPSSNVKYPLFFTRRNCCVTLSLCFIGCIIHLYISGFYTELVIAKIFIFWFGYLLFEKFFNWYKKKKIENNISSTIQSMVKLSLLVQKCYHFLHDCDNLYQIYTYANNSKDSKKNCFGYLLMPELKEKFIILLHNLINHHVSNITEIQKKILFKEFVSNFVYLYHSDCKFDIQNFSLENINKAKYIFFLLQSEFLKLSALCLCPVLWKVNCTAQINYLFSSITNLNKVYCDLNGPLYEEFNVYSLFTNNKNYNHGNEKKDVIDSDLKSKIVSVRQHIQKMMVHIKFIEDSFDSDSKPNQELNVSLDKLSKEAHVFNELISTLQIHILKYNNKNYINEENLFENTININQEIDKKYDEVNFNNSCEDELFFGISDDKSLEVENTCNNNEIYDTAHNANLIMELRVALQGKQIEWQERESNLLKKHPELSKNVSHDESTDSEEYEAKHSIRKVARDFPLENVFPMALPIQNFANDIASIASTWNNIAVESFGNDSDTESESVSDQ